MKGVISTVFITFLTAVYSEVFPTEIDLNQLNQINGKMPGIYMPDVKYIMATVSLRDKNDIQFCLGTAFRPRHILTTATCVYNQTRADDVEGMYVWVGGNFNPEDGVKYNVQKINVNSNYESEDAITRMRNDIAIITLTKPLPTFISLIPVSLQLEAINNESAKVITWNQDCTITSRSLRVGHLEFLGSSYLFAYQSADVPYETVNNDKTGAGTALVHKGKIIGIRIFANLHHDSAMYKYTILPYIKNLRFINSSLLEDMEDGIY